MPAILPAIQWLTSYSEYLEDLTPGTESMFPELPTESPDHGAILNQKVLSYGNRQTDRKRRSSG